MQGFSYPALFLPDEDGRILVTLRDFPFAATDGEDHAEAAVEAVDLLESVLAQLVSEGADVPLPSPPQADETLVTPSAVTAAQVALHAAMRRQGVAADELASRLGTTADAVRRLVDLSTYPPLEAIEHALAVLGHRLTVALDAAE